MRESCTRSGSEVLGYTRQDPFLYTLQLELTEASDTSIQAERLRIGFRTPVAHPSQSFGKWSR